LTAADRWEASRRSRSSSGRARRTSASSLSAAFARAGERLEARDRREDQERHDQQHRDGGAADREDPLSLSRSTLRLPLLDEDRELDGGPRGAAFGACSVTA
jgi:hypothetical protein